MCKFVTIFFFNIALICLSKACTVHEGVGGKFNFRFFYSNALSYSGRENRFQKYVVLTLLRETRMNYFDISHLKKKKKKTLYHVRLMIEWNDPL